MLDTDSWVILDTETTGLKRPVYPVEIAAQRMLGWQPDGPPFRALLNFDVPIEPMAQQIHGYSREYLRANGASPAEALCSFLEYAHGDLLVAYNLQYDCATVLAPTLNRMRVQVPLRPGFCALNLARTVTPSLPNFKLHTVMTAFGLADRQEHHALSDVGLVAQFLCGFVGPHLKRSGVHGFEQVALCSEGKLPVPPLVPPVNCRRPQEHTKA